MRGLGALTFLAVGLAAQAGAVELSAEGYVDLRLVHAPDERAWQDGGLGKTRFGGGDGLRGELVEAVLEVKAEVTPELSGFIGLRADEYQRSAVDVMEAYLTYAPEALGPWRWQVKAGAFYAPISLENDQIGWASSWTVTPSAINSWVGEELRTVGVEAKAEWRGEDDRIAVLGALYGLNDPAGVLIAARGWSLGERPTGLFDHVRLPDANAIQNGGAAPQYSPMFLEIDDRIGWYAGVSWAHTGWGRLLVLRYDNLGDPAAFREEFAWRTKFWSVGYEAQTLGLVLKAQALTGDTNIRFAPGFEVVTDYSSAFVLVGKVIGKVRLAGRAEMFETSETDNFPFASFEGGNGERGHAFTLGGFWTPEPWLQLGAEWLRVESDRPQREVAGLPAETTNTQVQLDFRLFY